MHICPAEITYISVLKSFTWRVCTDLSWGYTGTCLNVLSLLYLSQLQDDLCRLDVSSNIHQLLTLRLSFVWNPEDRKLERLVFRDASPGATWRSVPDLTELCSLRNFHEMAHWASELHMRGGSGLRSENWEVRRVWNRSDIFCLSGEQGWISFTCTISLKQKHAQHKEMH